MTNKITIIGAGSVGSTIAYTLAVNGIASEVVLIDVNTQKALGEAMDIRQATPFAAQTQVYAGSYSDAKDSNIVIVTSGIADWALKFRTGCGSEFVIVNIQGQ